jgi:hypothetical protein
MGFLRNPFGGLPGTDAMRIDSLMEYWIGPGFGSAALRWHDSQGGGEAVKAHLVALLRDICSPCSCGR